MLGWGGRDLGWVYLFVFCPCVVWGLGLGFVWKNALWFETSFFYYTCCHFCIVLLVPLVVWLVKYLGWAFVTAAAFQHLFLVLCYINFLPLQVTYFRALPHSLGYIFQYIFLSLMILNIMHHVHDCNRVLEVRRGLVVSIVLFPPTSLKDRVIKALELCSCGKEKKKKKKKKHVWFDQAKWVWSPKNMIFVFCLFFGTFYLGTLYFNLVKTLQRLGNWFQRYK